MAQFKARARTVDMLGRQQIAGIPTAISELFKNAHDAYADRVYVDFFRNSGFFVLRDDGLGMTRQDFEERWLTLGTDSQLNSKVGLSPPPKFPGKKSRPILGEKGIGRLAIASIGTQVLILSRAIREGSTCNLIVAFINWSLFEFPGINLDEIIIPLAEFSHDSFPNLKDISEMVNEVKQKVIKLYNDGKIEDSDYTRIIEESNRFIFDPIAFYSSYQDLTLQNQFNGTHFIVLTKKEDIFAVIDEDKKSDKASDLVKSLLGFTNTMIPVESEPIMKTKFRDHITDLYYEDLIDSQIFWNSEEFKEADHHLIGSFDRYGQFNGTVEVYGKEKPYVLSWTEGIGKETLCGSFTIRVAYIQGSKKESQLDPERWAVIDQKLKRIGGLYVYRDNIRILPYGDSNHDFLNIEKRRNLGAGYYFYSFRRMFGYISITKEENLNLKEKAGREGFQQNNAFRQFRGILENFFIQSAQDFFKSNADGENPTFFQERKEELLKLYNAKIQADKRNREKRIKFLKELEIYIQKIQDKEPEKEIENLISNLKNDLAGFQAIFEDSNDISYRILQCEKNAFSQLKKLKEQFKINKPSGVGLGKKISGDWDFYSKLYSELNNITFINAEKDISSIISGVVSDFSLDLSKQIRFQSVLIESIEKTEKDFKSKSKDASLKTEEVTKRIKDLIQDLRISIKNDMEKWKSEISNNVISDLSDSNLVENKILYEKRFSEYIDQKSRVLEEIRDQLENIRLPIDNQSDFISNSEEREAIDNELLTLRDQIDLDLELSQLGTAISIIHHEFIGSAKGIHNAITELKSWADINEDMIPLYNHIQSNFDHLEGYLTLFTPLNKRQYRKKIFIEGMEIFEYCSDIFEDRLSRHDIKIEKTKKFVQKEIFGYPSTLYPAYINIIDNAIFWLSRSRNNKKIKLDADENNLYISNNGEPIDERDVFMGSIFEAHFSRKPGGRGMGLYISKQVLKREGFDLLVSEPRPGMTVTFKISLIGDDSTDD